MGSLLGDGLTLPTVALLASFTRGFSSSSAIIVAVVVRDCGIRGEVSRYLRREHREILFKSGTQDRRLGGKPMCDSEPLENSAISPKPFRRLSRGVAGIACVCHVSAIGELAADRDDESCEPQNCHRKQRRHGNIDETTIFRQST